MANVPGGATSREPGAIGVAALIPAAGQGERLSARGPKALVPLAGRPLVGWCLEALAHADGIEHLVIAVPAGTEDRVQAIAVEYASDVKVDIVAGGTSRSESVHAALQRVVDSQLVAIHDAARPLVTPDLVDSLVASLKQWGCAGVVPAASVTDTVKEADEAGRVVRTLARERLWAVQTPQVFVRSELDRAFEKSGGSSPPMALDEAQLVEAAGGQVRIHESPPDNIKVTNATDLALAELLLNRRLSQ